MVILLLALLLQVGPPPGVPTARDAERLYAAAAAKAGPTAAARRFADADAIVFTPQPVRAQAWLESHDWPATARRPTAYFVSCDGLSAVDTGPAFAAVWRSGTPEGWHWLLTSHDPAAAAYSPAMPSRAPTVRRAGCKGVPGGVPADREEGGVAGGGASADGTLAWRWHVAPDGARTVRAFLWTGTGWARVVDQRVAAPSAGEAGAGSGATPAP